MAVVALVAVVLVRVETFAPSCRLDISNGDQEQALSAAVYMGATARCNTVHMFMEVWRMVHLVFCAVLLMCCGLRYRVYPPGSFRVMRSIQPAAMTGSACVVPAASGLACGCTQTWLILPAVICLSQRLSHACPSISFNIAKLRMAH